MSTTRFIPALLLFALSVAVLTAAKAAEEEITLLTVEGDLIGIIDTLPEAATVAQTIAAYYELLPEDIRAQANRYRSQLARLVPDYEVAYNAADSAEITQVRSDIFELWASIQTLHGAYFNREVTELLRLAYQQQFARILSPN